MGAKGANFGDKLQRKSLICSARQHAWSGRNNQHESV